MEERSGLFGVVEGLLVVRDGYSGSGVFSAFL